MRRPVLGVLPVAAALAGSGCWDEDCSPPDALAEGTYVVRVIDDGPVTDVQVVVAGDLVTIHWTMADGTTTVQDYRVDRYEDDYP